MLAVSGEINEYKQTNKHYKYVAFSSHKDICPIYPSTFRALKMLLKHNVPSYFTCLPVYALYFALYFNGTELVERSTQNVR